MDVKDKKMLLIIIIISIIFSVTVVCVTGINMHIQEQKNNARIDGLVLYAVSSFIERDFDEYLNKLRTCGLNDITVEFSSTYSIDGKDALTVWITIQNIISEDVDAFYTTQIGEDEGIALVRIMRSITENDYRTYTYTSETEDEIEVIVSTQQNYLTITSPSGHIYEYEYGTSDWEIVKIDDKWVYHGQVAETYTPGLNQGKCVYGNCSFDAKAGSNYCNRHGCCKDNCPNEKAATAHCCDMHNCKAPGCGGHRYDFKSSEYCSAHYNKEFVND